MKEFIYKSIAGIFCVWHIYYIYWFLTIHNTIKKESLKFGISIPKQNTA